MSLPQEMRSRSPSLDVQTDPTVLREADYAPSLQSLADGGFETRLPNDFARANGLDQGDEPDRVLWNRDGLIVLDYQADD